MEREEDKRPGESGDRNSKVAVSSFDYSVENFFTAMRAVSELCREPGENSFDGAEVQRFSSMITFLREWKQFCYEPKVVNFSYETQSGQINQVTNGITLAQFSSAAVPKMEQLPDESGPPYSDFILHAGGPVWALDWCPRIHERSDDEFRCEYLAVAAHPPGSSYHKLGNKLIGRGVIQIWCLLSVNQRNILSPTTPRHNGRGRPRKIIGTDSVDTLSKNETSSPRPRGRPRKNFGEKNSEPKPRGRPRKRPYPTVDDSSGKDLTHKRPRGRPKKRATDVPTNEDLLPSSSDLIPSMGENIHPFNIDLGGAALALPAPVDLDYEEEKIMRRLSGSPRKNLESRRNKGLSVPAEGLNISPSPTFEGNGDLSTIGLLVGCQEDEASGGGSWDGSGDGIADVVSGSTTVDLSLTCSADTSAIKNLPAPRRQGRPRKNPVRNPIGNIPCSGVDLREDGSALPALGGLEKFCNNIVPEGCKKGEKSVIKPGEGIFNVMEESNCCSVAALALPTTADLGTEKESVVSRRRGRPKKNSIRSPNKNILSSAADLVEDGSNLPTSRELVHLSEHGLVEGFSGDQVFVTRTSEDSEGMAVSKPGSTAVAGLSAENETLVQKCGGRPTSDPVREQNVSGNEYPGKSGEDASSVPLLPTDENDFQDQMRFSKEAGMHRSSASEVTSCMISEDIALPRGVLFLAHNGKVAWDVKWRPLTVHDSEDNHHLGYLAVLLGNGSLEVWEVPHPSVIKSLYLSSSVEGTDPRFLKLIPVFRCSKVKSGGTQSIPLIVEWSPSDSHDLLLAGCHDGTVALWKFAVSSSSQDSKPLLCFTADNVPIRALAWAPEASDAESSNLIVTAGTEGIKFWDLRDPYHPLWCLNPVQRSILSLEWVKDPRCVILALDDGTLRALNLYNSGCDIPVTGKPFNGTKPQLLHSYICSSFAIWSVQVSQTTGLGAYCSASGSAHHFQLTAKSIKDSRNRVPHFLCGSLAQEGQTLRINTPMSNMPHKSSIGWRAASMLSTCDGMSDTDQAGKSSVPTACSSVDRPMSPGSGIIFVPEMKKSRPKNHDTGIPNPSQMLAPPIMAKEEEQQEVQCSVNGKVGSKVMVESFPPKIVSMHRVRWNMNKGSERWLCYGGAAGLVRCQDITMTKRP